ncbi:hypothetical protein JVT61DRAFT_3798 [Boletus reticuloceps]|uniref:WW domain-containing protein n=1 Tax=Boletus reticuloceps TaxID=495285 RepID=A0A8I2YLZ9_9AGAM|nr:hypothetical protein JVT61DRAFT_3798 [Boletus reticuloceps]
MASPPSNPDSRDLPHGWIQQYNYEFYVNMRENPPRSCWEHPLGPIPQGFAPSMGPPPDRSYSRSPYGGPQPPPQQGYGGYQDINPLMGSLLRAITMPNKVDTILPGTEVCREITLYVLRCELRAFSDYPPQERVVYVEEERRQRKKGPGLGTAVAAGGAGLLGGVLLTEAFENHDEYERDQGFDQVRKRKVNSWDWGVAVLSGLFRSTSCRLVLSDSASDHNSTYYSAETRGARSPPRISEVGVVTPAQAYASAIRTGETNDRDAALRYTIQRKQPERKGKAYPYVEPSRLGYSRSPEQGLSFAQRLYASALSHKSSNLPSSDIPVLQPVKYVPSSALPIAGGSQASLPSLMFDTSPEDSQPFNPADLYHTNVLSRSPSSPETGETRPRPLLPPLQIPNSSPVAWSHSTNPQAYYFPLQNATPQPEVRGIHEILGPQEHPIETRPPIVAGRMAPLFPLGQQLATAPSSLAIKEYERLPNPYEAVTVDVAPVVIQSAASRKDGLPNRLAQPSPEADLEVVPLYSLVDEQLPPPAFDDLQPENATEVTTEQSLAMHHETLPLEKALAQPSRSTAYDPGEAPAYAPPDEISYPAGASKSMLQNAGILIPSGASSSDAPSVVPTNFQSPNPMPSVSPSTSPPPSNSHSLSVLSPHSPVRQSIRPSCDPLSAHKMTSISPPPVNYHTKPTATQRHDFSPIVKVAEDNYAIDTLTRSMSNMMGGPSLDTYSLTSESLPYGRQNTLGTSPGNQPNNLIALSSHPSGTRETMGSLKQGTSRTEAESLIQEAYQRPTHGGTAGKAGYRIQGSGSGSFVIPRGYIGLTRNTIHTVNPPVVNILPLQYSLPTNSSLDPIPPGYSHTEGSGTVEDGLILNQFGETVATSSSRSSHPDQHQTALDRSFPYPLQPSHHTINQDINGAVAHPGPGSSTPKKLLA